MFSKISRLATDITTSCNAAFEQWKGDDIATCVSSLATIAERAKEIQAEALKMIEQLASAGVEA